MHIDKVLAEVGRTIARLKEGGQSILLVEQNLRLAFDLADEVVVLNTGRVAFAGSVAAARGNEDMITQNLGVSRRVALDPFRQGPGRASSRPAALRVT